MNVTGNSDEEFVKRKKLVYKKVQKVMIGLSVLFFFFFLSQGFSGGLSIFLGLITGTIVSYPIAVNIEKKILHPESDNLDQ